MANEYSLTAINLEPLTADGGEGRVAALHAEVLHTDDVGGEGRIYAGHIETIHTDQANLPLGNLTAIGLEVLRPIPELLSPEFATFEEAAYEPSYVVAFNMNPAGLDDIVAYLFEADFGVEPPVLPMEWNPYRPDVPVELAEGDPAIYDHMRTQAETLREQHDLTQAGDTTFPWEMTAKEGLNKEFTLGSITRFFHADFGLIQARYVKFSKGWGGRLHVPVGHDTAESDWVVTDILKDSSPNRVIGLSLPYAPELGTKYGWVQTQGRNLVELLVEVDELKPYMRLSWASDGRLSDGPGPAVAMILDLPAAVGAAGAFRVPVGGAWIDATGFTEQYYRELAVAALAELEDRVTTIETTLEADTIDYSAAIDSLTTGLDQLTARFNLESAAQGRQNQAVVNRIDSIQRAIEELGAVDDSGLRARLSAVEGQAEANRLAIRALGAPYDTRLDELEYWRSTTQAALDGFAGTIAALNRDDANRNFLSLPDTPIEYATFGGKIVAVKADESGLEFIDAPAGGGGGGGGVGVIYGIVAGGLNASPSTFAANAKGIDFLVVDACQIQKVRSLVNPVAGATYQAFVFEHNGSTVTAITATSAVHAETTTATRRYVTLSFASPVSLVAGVRYGIYVSRTDQSGTFATTFYYANGNTPFAGLPLLLLPGSIRSTVVTPIVGTSILTTADTYFLAIQGTV